VAAVRYGSRPCCVRRCGPTTNPRGAQYMGIKLGRARAHAVRNRRAEGHRHMSAIAAGEVIWCQGLFRPEAGTDLSVAAGPARSPTVTVGASPDRKSGPPTPDGVMVACWRRAPTRMPRKPAGSASFWFRWTGPGITVRPIRSMLGPPSPQRGLSRRCRGVPRRGPRRIGRRLAGDARSACLRARRHRPVRPVRITARPDANRTR